MGADLGARAISHLEHLSDEGIDAMVARGICTKNMHEIVVLTF